MGKDYKEHLKQQILKKLNENPQSTYGEIRASISSNVTDNTLAKYIMELINEGRFKPGDVFNNEKAQKIQDDGEER